MDGLTEIFVGVELLPRSQELSEGSWGAFRQALSLAILTGSRLSILHSTWHEGEDVPLTEAGRAALDRLVSEAISSPVRAQLVVTSERPWIALLRAASRREADLVVIGKRETQHAPSGRRLGSVATKLVRDCPAPVWVVKPGHDLKLKLLLVATDLTPVGDCALHFGAALARWRQGELHVIHAWRLDQETRAKAKDMEHAEWEALIEGRRAEVRAVVLERCQRFATGLEPQLHLARNAPAHAIKDAADHLQPDLLLLGSLSRAGRTGVFVGETAERLLGRLECSLLVLKPQDFECPMPCA